MTTHPKYPAKLSKRQRGNIGGKKVRISAVSDYPQKDCHWVEFSLPTEPRRHSRAGTYLGDIKPRAPCAGSSKVVSTGQMEDRESDAAGSRRSGTEADQSGSETVKVFIHAGMRKDGETTFKVTTQPDQHSDYKSFSKGLNVALDDCTAEYSNLTNVNAEDCNTRFKKWVPDSKAMSAYTQSMGKIGIEVIYG